MKNLVKTCANGDKYIGFEFEKNIDSGISEAHGHLLVWSGYALIYNSEKFFAQKDEKTYSLG